MLVLSRKLHDSIVIGDGIEITVIAIDRHRVKVGIEAPAEVNIVRSELLRSSGKVGKNSKERVPKNPDPDFQVETTLRLSPK